MSGRGATTQARGFDPQVSYWLRALAAADPAEFTVCRDERGYPVSVEWEAARVVEGRRASASATDLGDGDVLVGGGDNGVLCQWLLAMHQSEWRRDRRREGGR